MHADDRELAIEIGLLLGFHVWLLLLLLGVSMAFPFVGFELAKLEDPTDIEASLLEPRVYAMAYVSLAVPVTALVVVGLGIRRLAGANRAGADGSHRGEEFRGGWRRAAATTKRIFL